MQSGDNFVRLNLILSPNNFTQGHSMKIEMLVADVTAVRFPDRAERAILGTILAGHFFHNSGRFCCPGATL